MRCKELWCDTDTDRLPAGDGDTLHWAIVWAGQHSSMISTISNIASLQGEAPQLYINICQIQYCQYDVQFRFVVSISPSQHTVHAFVQYNGFNLFYLYAQLLKC